MWYFDYSLTAPSRLARQQGGPPETIAEFPPWDPRRAVLEALDAALAGAPGAVDLPEGMRAMELAEAAERSLKRGRTVEMHYDEISELSSFKASMTSIGCALVLLSLVLYVLSRVGLALGIDAAKYLAWAVVPLLGIYGLLQFLRFAARPANADPSR